MSSPGFVCPGWPNGSFRSWRRALIAPCAVTDLEVLYSARRLVDYEEVRAERRSLDSAPITPEVMETAIDLQHALAARVSIGYRFRT